MATITDLNMRNLAFSLAVTTAAFTAFAGEFTPAERASVQRLAATIETSCKAQHSEVLLQVERSLPGAAVIARSMDFPRYCACLRNGVELRMTPAFVRSGTEAQAAELMDSIGGSCAAAAMLDAISSGSCSQWMALHRKDEATPPKSFAQSCECLKSEVSKLDGSAFAEAMRQSAAAGEEFQASGKFPSVHPSSMLHKVRACVLGAVAP